MILVADEIGGSITTPKPALASQEEDTQAYTRQRAIQAGAFDLAGAAVLGPADMTAKAALKAKGIIVNPRTQADFRFLLKQLVEKNGTPDQFKSLLLHAESWGHDIDKFRKALGTFFPWH